MPDLRHLCVRETTTPGEPTQYKAICGATGTERKRFPVFSGSTMIEKTTCPECMRRVKKGLTMKFRITYWDAGDKHRTKEVEAETEQDAIDLLADDERHPLAQVDRGEIIEDE